MHRTVDGDVPRQARIDADLLKEILDFVEDGVCLLDRDNRARYWNHRRISVIVKSPEKARRTCWISCAFPS